jgi:hypothetical protein
MLSPQNAKYVFSEDAGLIRVTNFFRVAHKSSIGEISGELVGESMMKFTLSSSQSTAI